MAPVAIHYTIQEGERHHLKDSGVDLAICCKFVHVNGDLVEFENLICFEASGRSRECLAVFWLPSYELNRVELIKAFGD